VKNVLFQSLVFVTAGLLLSLPVLAAGIPKNLPYPTGTLSADEIATQVYFVNHFYALKNYSIQKKGKRNITVIINKALGKRPTTNTVERHLNNDYNDGIVKAKDLAIFRSGKLRGTGMLITDYVDDNKSQSYAIWLPALRKIRRFAEPAHDDAWGGSDFTFGDVSLRKPHHETHELVGMKVFKDCLGVMNLQYNKYMKKLPSSSCAPKGKAVYKLKSTTQFKNWWYDYRISYVDTKTFADYRTDYFKNGKHIKVIDRDWNTLPGYKGDDPRHVSWGYWYGKNLTTGHKTWAVIPKLVVAYNQDKKSSFWSERTLRRIKR
jgi:hypothetical protein